MEVVLENMVVVVEKMVVVVEKIVTEVVTAFDPPPTNIPQHSVSLTDWS